MLPVRGVPHSRYEDGPVTGPPYDPGRSPVGGFLEALGITGRVTFVGHDWGGVLAVDRARARPAAVRGIAYLETLVAPVSWDGPNAPAPELFGPLRGAAGEEMVLRDNVFVETVLPAGTVRTLRTLP